MSLLNSENIPYLVEIGEAKAYTDAWIGAPDKFTNSYKLHFEKIGSSVAIMMRETEGTFANRVIGLGLNEPVTEILLDDIIERYNRVGIESFAIHLSPHAKPDRLSSWLAERGFRHEENWAKVCRDLSPPPAPLTDLRIEKVGTEWATAFAEIICRAFNWQSFLTPWLAATVGRPGWHHYVAFEGSLPVATSVLFVQSQVGWFGLAGTLSEYRGRGAQGAIMAQKIRDAHSFGCRLLITETEEDKPNQPNASYRNMLRMGFRLVHLRPSYVFKLIK